MTTFDEREHAFEEKFAHDQELRFKVHARRNRLLGKWAADRLGLTGPAAETYAASLAQLDATKFNDDALIRRVVDDLTAKGKATTESEVRSQLTKLLPVAKKEISGQA
jgi:hypothetical protein